MRKSEIVERVAASAGLSRSVAGRVADGIIGEIFQALVDGERVTLAGFGTFSTKARGARISRNPKTGEAVHVEAKRVPSFKAGKVLRDAVALDGSGLSA